MNRFSTFLFVVLMLLTDVISAQIKNLTSLKWSVAAYLPAAGSQKKALGFAGPVTGVYQDALIIAGGANFPGGMPWQGGKKKYYADVYVYEKKGSKIILAESKFKLPANVAYAANCSTSQGIFYAGGENETGISKKVFLLQWNNLSAGLTAKQLPDLPIALTNAAAAVIGTRIYLAGGETANGVSDSFFILDISNVAGGWKVLPPLPLPVSHAVMVSLPGQDQTTLFLIGGRKRNATGISDLYRSVLEFDIVTNQWKEKKPLPYELSAGTGMAMGGSVLIFGGDRGTTFHKVEILMAAINTEKEETKKQDLILQKNILQANHPGFSKEVLLYTAVTDSWEKISILPFETPVTTTAVKWGNDIFIPSGEIKAGVRSPKILSVTLSPKEK